MTPNDGLPMDTEPGRNLIVWTVRICVALYATAVWRHLFYSSPENPSTKTADLWYVRAWSLSWLLCVIHVLCAYHFEHHWNQSAALQHTADMTNRVVGINWPGGLYVNYIFLTYWGFDVFRRLKSGGSSSLAMHIIAAFMMFNATVVFGPQWWFVPTIAFGIAMLIKYFRRNP